LARRTLQDALNYTGTEAIRRSRRFGARWVVLLILATGLGNGQVQTPLDYALGPDDQIVIRAIDAEEISGTPYRIDAAGNVDLPLVGILHAGGLTVGAFKAALVERLKSWVKEPMVTVVVTEFRSLPISILGAVNKPGVYQVNGNKRLFEVLSLAEGLKPEAGNWVKVTRLKSSGVLPLRGAKLDQTGDYWVAEVKVKSILAASNPAENIAVRPNDVISVPSADLVYVTGCVRKSGGFVMNEKESISVLQALSLAEGLDRLSAARKSRILRLPTDGSARIELPIDIQKILEGKAQDVPLIANDILFIPNSTAKNVAMRTLETAISLGTGIAIYRR
jgi:polysaccharide biosynthesis/export protein